MQHVPPATDDEFIIKFITKSANFFATRDAPTKRASRSEQPRFCVCAPNCPPQFVNSAALSRWAGTGQARSCRSPFLPSSDIKHSFLLLKGFFGALTFSKMPCLHAPPPISIQSNSTDSVQARLLRGQGPAPRQAAASFPALPKGDLSRVLSLPRVAARPHRSAKLSLAQAMQLAVVSPFSFHSSWQDPQSQPLFPSGQRDKIHFLGQAGDNGPQRWPPPAFGSSQSPLVSRPRPRACSSVLSL